MTKIPDSPEHHVAIKELAIQDKAYRDALINEAKTFGKYQKLLAESRNITDFKIYHESQYSYAVRRSFAGYSVALEKSLEARHALLLAAKNEGSYHNLQESVNTEVND